MPDSKNAILIDGTDDALDCNIKLQSGVYNIIDQDCARLEHLLLAAEKFSQYRDKVILALQSGQIYLEKYPSQISCQNLPKTTVIDLCYPEKNYTLYQYLGFADLLWENYAITGEVICQNCKTRNSIKTDNLVISDFLKQTSKISISAICSKEYYKNIEPQISAYSFNEFEKHFEICIDKLNGNSPLIGSSIRTAKKIGDLAVKLQAEQCLIISNKNICKNCYSKFVAPTKTNFIDLKNITPEQILIQNYTLKELLDLNLSKFYEIISANNLPIWKNARILNLNESVLTLSNIHSLNHEDLMKIKILNALNSSNKLICLLYPGLAIKPENYDSFKELLNRLQPTTTIVIVDAKGLSNSSKPLDLSTRDLFENSKVSMLELLGIGKTLANFLEKTTDCSIQGIQSKTLQKYFRTRIATEQIKEVKYKNFSLEELMQLPLNKFLAFFKQLKNYERILELSKIFKIQPTANSMLSELSFNQRYCILLINELIANKAKSLKSLSEHFLDHEQVNLINKF